MYMITNILILLFAVVTAMPPPKQAEQRELPEGFPEPLVAKNFQSTLAKGLHIVEFYSPYCGHCKQLAPIWEETWVEFKEEGEKIGVTFSQVDCVQSGDICSKERIHAFPSIILYQDGERVDQFSDRRTKENFIMYARKAAMKLGGNQDVIIPARSKLLMTMDFAQLISGQAEKPTLISFWPTDELKEDSSEKVKFDKCSDCSYYQKHWALLTNDLEKAGIETAHVNCKTAKNLCKQLGFNELVSSGSATVMERKPRLAYILPEKVTNNLFIYPDYMDLFDNKQLTDYLERITINSEASLITENDVIGYATNFEPLYSQAFVSKNDIKNKPSEQKIHVIFMYNNDTVVPEDFTLLQHLVEPLSRRPNTYLHSYCGDFRSLVDKTYEQYYNLINYNSSEKRKEFSEHDMNIETTTELPTFMIIKEGELKPHIFNAYSTTEMRQLDTVLEWIDEIIVPTFSRLSIENLQEQLSLESSIYNTLAIIMVDSKNDYDDKSAGLYKFLTGIYDYEYFRMKKMFENIGERREKKLSAIDKMKERKEKNGKILAKMREEIPHHNDLKIHAVFMDIETDIAVLRKLDIDPKRIRSNRVLFLDKMKMQLFTEGVGGPIFGPDSYGIRETLLSINIPSKAENDIKLKGKLLKGSYLPRGFTKHHHNILYYIGFALVVFIVIRLKSVARMFKRKVGTSKYRTTSLSKLEAQD
ncbi:ER-retained PMA1-suppressing protein 1 [Nakaseomyces bracarensis]|uniref:ER-retained PMA1-suppressing protein 1 n=1 Tax=Nakaseomyces bracarensis TaxID=273131 RepID=A0ABR4NWB4_9SACH